LAGMSLSSILRRARRAAARASESSSGSIGARITIGLAVMTFACALCLGDIMVRRWQRPSRQQSSWYFRSAHASYPACAPSRPSPVGGFFLPRAEPDPYRPEQCHRKRGTP
jgi:hypothetical protein